MNQYQFLVEVIDRLRDEAPDEYKFYKPSKSESEKLNQARARAYIHLFLKSRFGILEFLDREKLVTDGPNDGGIDGYYIDSEKKKVYLIQSKFRRSRSNFEEKEIQADELLKMDVDKILQGETCNEDGIKYNSKILELQRSLRRLSDIGKYQYEIIILANLKSISPGKLSTLFGGLLVTIYNFKKTYSELLFPILTGTFYNYPDLFIKVNLFNKSSGKISYTVTTEFGPCEIALLFVPVSEIAKIMYKYRNSILRYNPRSYLTLREGSINEEIKNTILSKDTNEFALFNNGITILSEETNFNDKIAEREIAQLCLKNPQIINGGQTAFTLSLIFEESKLNSSIERKLSDKEVLIRVITFKFPNFVSDEKKIQLIEAISSATNQQSQVDTSDRSSNNPFLIESQKTLFTDFGVLLERKRGEFFDGIRYGYINEDHVINRSVYLRIAFACNGYPIPPSKKKNLYSEENIDALLNTKANFRKYYFGCLCYSAIVTYEDKTGLEEATQSGIYAILSVCLKEYDRSIPDSELTHLAKNSVEAVVKRWLDFEDYALNQFYNSAFFKISFNFKTKGYQVSRYHKSYYHGHTLIIDLNDFFFPEIPYFSEEYSNRKKLVTIDDFLKRHKLDITTINKIKPKVKYSGRYDKNHLIQLSQELDIDIETVRNATKYIISRDIGYYLWYYQF